MKIDLTRSRSTEVGIYLSSIFHRHLIDSRATGHMHVVAAEIMYHCNSDGNCTTAAWKSCVLTPRTWPSPNASTSTTSSNYHRHANAREKQHVLADTLLKVSISMVPIHLLFKTLPYISYDSTEIDRPQSTTPTCKPRKAPLIGAHKHPRSGNRNSIRRLPPSRLFHLHRIDLRYIAFRDSWHCPAYRKDKSRRVVCGLVCYGQTVSDVQTQTWGDV